jgi:hypothetical protein
MNSPRFTSPLAEHTQVESQVAQAFVVVPACVLPTTPMAGGFQSQLYAWAFAQAQATQQPTLRTPELFGIFN